MTAKLRWSSNHCNHTPEKTLPGMIAARDMLGTYQEDRILRSCQGSLVRGATREELVAAAERALDHVYSRLHTDNQAWRRCCM